jgi:signal transduction histidine kinase
MNACDGQKRPPGSFYGAVAYGVVVLTCFADYFFDRRFFHGEWMVLLTVFLAAVYTAFGVLGDDLMGERGSRKRALYFVIQCALLTVMVYFSPIRNFFGIIVLPAASQSIFDLSRRWGAAVTLYLFAVCIGVWGIDLGWQVMLEAAVSYSAGFAFTIAFTLITKQALIAREREEKLRREIEAANVQLRAHAAQTEDLATTRERNRLAREIHDGLGHYLTVVKTQLDAAAGLVATRPEEARASIIKAAKLTGDALDDVRRSVGALRTDAARPPLPDALRALTAESDLPVTVRLEGAARSLPPGIEHALFRSAQEGLTNVRKHAAASAAELLLDFRAPGRVTLAVTDNGRGAPGVTAGGFGLRGIAERIEVLGGRVQSGNGAGGGFALVIEMPA